jgi:hypothetical protein
VTSDIKVPDPDRICGLLGPGNVGRRAPEELVVGKDLRGDGHSGTLVVIDRATSKRFGLCRGRRRR